MCLVREYKRYIANVHINEKIIHHCDVMSFHHRKDINNVTIKLKILQDIHSEKINTVYYYCLILYLVLKLSITIMIIMVTYYVI